MLTTRKTYQSCSEMPLANFIKLSVNADLNYMYSEPKTYLNLNVSNDKLQQGWEAIFDEYQSLSSSNENKHLISLIKDINHSSASINLIHMVCGYLHETGYDAELVAILKGYGFRDAFKPDTLQSDIQKVMTSTKSRIMRLKEAQTEYDQLQAKNKPLTEKDFNAMLVDLSKHFGFKIDPASTTVLDFINYIESFNRDNKPKQQNG